MTYSYIDKKLYVTIHRHTRPHSGDRVAAIRQLQRGRAPYQVGRPYDIGSDAAGEEIARVQCPSIIGASSIAQRAMAEYQTAIDDSTIAWYEASLRDDDDEIIDMMLCVSALSDDIMRSVVDSPIDDHAAIEWDTERSDWGSSDSSCVIRGSVIRGSVIGGPSLCSGDVTIEIDTRHRTADIEIDAPGSMHDRIIRLTRCELESEGIAMTSIRRI